LALLHQIYVLSWIPLSVEDLALDSRDIHKLVANLAN
jgi:hypothetical protein